MSGGPALGRWEVKDCKSHKAMSVCEQNVSSYHDVHLPEHHIDAYAPCPPGWESDSGLLHCFKVVLLIRKICLADLTSLTLKCFLFHVYPKSFWIILYKEKSMKM